MNGSNAKEDGAKAEPPFGLKEAISLHKDQTDRSDRLWNYYIIVTLGVLGFVLSGNAASRLPGVRYVLLGGYILFFTVNLWALWTTQKTLALLNSGIAETLKNREDSREEFNEALLSLKRAESWQMAPFHLLLDISVSIIIYKTLSP